MYGITDSDLQYILNIIRQHNKIEQAIIFGSRAMDKDKKGSDIDIVVKGNSLGDIVSQISAQLNQESLLPYYFDIIDYDSITNQNLLDHIKRVGKIIYQKS